MIDLLERILRLMIKASLLRVGFWLSSVQDRMRATESNTSLAASNSSLGTCGRNSASPNSKSDLHLDS